jgi:hypothetical protein
MAKELEFRLSGQRGNVAAVSRDNPAQLRQRIGDHDDVVDSQQIATELAIVGSRAGIPDSSHFPLDADRSHGGFSGLSDFRPQGLQQDVGHFGFQQHRDIGSRVEIGIASRDSHILDDLPDRYFAFLAM